MKQLETPRLILRGFVMEDLDDFYSYCSDPDVGIHGGREAHQDREQSAEELRKRISEDKTWAICKKGKREKYRYGLAGTGFSPETKF